MRWCFLFLIGFLPAAYAEECVTTREGVRYTLQEKVDPATDLKRVLGFLRTFSASRDVVLRAAGDLDVGKIKVSGDFSLATSSAEDPLALFDFVKEVPTLILREGELGTLAVLVFHELVHATDEQVGASMSDEGRFTAERKAYDAQYALVKELRRSSTCANLFYFQRGEAGELFVGPVSNARIIGIYDLKL